MVKVNKGGFYVSYCLWFYYQKAVLNLRAAKKNAKSLQNQNIIIRFVLNLKIKVMKEIKETSVNKLISLFENDSEEDPIGVMYNLSCRISMPWRYVTDINGLKVFFEGSLNRDSSVVVDHIYTAKKAAKRAAKKYGAEIEPPYYSDPGQYWLRFTEEKNAFQFLVDYEKLKNQ